MSEFDVTATKALELANQLGGDAAEVVNRAEAYHVFLSGGRIPSKPATATTPAATKVPAAAPAATKVPAAAPAATKVPAAAPAATKVPAAAPAATKVPAAAPAATKVPAAAPAATKVPAAAKATKAATVKAGATPLDDVVAALQKVMLSIPGDNDKREHGRKAAYDILAAVGGVKSVRDLKPPLYDAVIAACLPKAAVAPPAKLDEFGGDPPEGTGGGLDAETGGLATAVDGEDL